MESNLVKLTPKKTMMRLCLTALIGISGLLPAHAGAGLLPSKDSSITVTSLGVRNDGMFFSFTVDNVHADKFSVEIKDPSGIILYKETVSGKVISKTFQAPTELGSVFLIITNLTDKKRQKFEVSQERHYVDDVAIISIR